MGSTGHVLAVARSYWTRNILPLVQQNKCEFSNISANLSFILTSSVKYLQTRSTLIARGKSLESRGLPVSYALLILLSGSANYLETYSGRDKLFLEGEENLRKIEIRVFAD